MSRTVTLLVERAFRAPLASRPCIEQLLSEDRPFHWLVENREIAPNTLLKDHPDISGLRVLSGPEYEREFVFTDLEVKALQQPLVPDLRIHDLTVEDLIEVMSNLPGFFPKVEIGRDGRTNLPYFASVSREDGSAYYGRSQTIWLALVQLLWLLRFRRLDAGIAPETLVAFRKHFVDWLLRMEREKEPVPDEQPPPAATLSAPSQPAFAHETGAPAVRVIEQALETLKITGVEVPIPVWIFDGPTMTVVERLGSPDADYFVHLAKDATRYALRCKQRIMVQSLDHTPAVLLNAAYVLVAEVVTYGAAAAGDATCLFNP